ncbi:hypothetical protein DOY81_001137 [Sarcophaga bullata]|nr:hypothetical protein DOY81_001137 [Sarcophaga bullata]
MQYIKCRFLILITFILFDNISCHLNIVKITTRMPKPKDLGLIFDVTVQNKCKDDKEPLALIIEPGGYCRVNVTPEIVMDKMGQVMGGNFGVIEPGITETVSVIWPTASLYNRVGLCPVTLITRTLDSEERIIKEIIKFDTRVEILDPDKRTIRKKNLKECQSWDQDYFKNCTPVDCEERYFGQRNFYNKKTQMCEEVPKCDESYQVYDTFTNECRDVIVNLSDEDVGYSKPGEFDVWEHEKYAIVFATIFIYCLICFGIFLIVLWLSRKPVCDKDCDHGTPHGSCIVLTPQNLRSVEENAVIYTTSSIMSQR